MDNAGGIARPGAAIVAQAGSSRALRREENLEEIVEEAAPEIGRRDALVIANGEPTTLSLVEALQCGGERKPRALYK